LAVVDSVEWRPCSIVVELNTPLTLEERLTAEAKRLREQARLLEPGPKHEEVLRRARQRERGLDITELLQSKGLQPLK
jgi:hypothetical protein